MYFIVDNDKKEIISSTDDLDLVKRLVNNRREAGDNVTYLDADHRHGIRYSDTNGWVQLQPFTGRWDHLMETHKPMAKKEGYDMTLCPWDERKKAIDNMYKYLNQALDTQCQYYLSIINLTKSELEAQIFGCDDLVERYMNEYNINAADIDLGKYRDMQRDLIKYVVEAWDTFGITVPTEV